jgi:peptidoglycan hydrolase-like protein with peptidoglycan-binding domain
MVKIIRDYYTQNRCYTNNRNYKKIGGVLHSTASKGVMARDWKRRWNNSTTDKCVTAFVDDTCVVECVPFSRQIWHVGVTKGNNYYIGIEICEDLDWARDYFEKAIANGLEYIAGICRDKGWTAKDWLGHYEANRLGFASNHSDPSPYFKHHGYSMDQFRADLDRMLTGEVKPVEPVVRDGIVVDGYMGPETIKALQGYFGTIQDGIISNPSMLIRELQKGLGVSVDGLLGPVTIKALQKHLGTMQDGIISKPSAMVKALQDRLNNGNLNLKIVKPIEPPNVPETVRLVEDGLIGPATIKRLQEYLGTPADGVISTPSSMVKELQKRLNNNKL